MMMMRGPGLLCLLCALLERLSRGCGLQHAVYWNSSNPRFLTEEYVVNVAINDYLIIYCPHYDSRVPVERTENFVLYRVNREGYEGCHKTSQALVRWECKWPYAPSGPIKFSEKIQRFTSFSLGVEFDAGQDYYYISIPEVGSIGECLKVRVSVCCRATILVSPAARPITEDPKSQPRGGGARSPSQGDPWRRSGGSSPQASPALLLALGLSLLCF
ncbi:ephrin-A4-like isoform X1 [Eleutherodactylus coqui]|uniref:ephrin-A4-like isoform X1 n=1 Tax=Eleutherodactylus coqui TaxID=57060 RepID=UPI003461E268